MPEGVGRDALEPGPETGRGEALLDVEEAPAVAVDDVAEVDAATTGSTKMRQEPRCNWDMRASLVGLSAPGPVEVDARAVEVDLGRTERPGRGPGLNPHSHQLPQLARITVARRRPAHVGRGLNVWSHLHIDDLAELYLRTLADAPPGSLYFRRER